MIRYFRGLALVILATSSVLAQTNTTLRKGMALENDEKIEEAILVYEDILGRGQNTGVIYRLASAYKKVGRYEDGINLLRKRLGRSPRDVAALNRLADLYLAAGRQAESELQIKRILEVSPNQGSYISVGQRYERLNQDERARDVYLKGRRELRDPELFSRELGQIYERAEKYPEAVKAYRTLARQKPQFVSLVESKLKTIARNAEDLGPLYDLLLEEMKGAHRDSRMTRLFTTFAIEAGMTPAALREMLTLPADAAIQGNLLRIGREALDHGDPGDAIAAFEALSARTRNRSLVVQAEAGIARGLDKAGRSDEAIQRYRDVLTSEANEHVREETSYRLGRLFLKIDLPDSAISILDRMIARGNRSKWRASAIDLLGDTQVKAGNEDLAQHAYRLNASENRGKEEASIALYKLARLHTIRKEYASAQKALKSILGGGLASTAYNDAIELSYTLEVGQVEDIPGLDVYARGLQQESSGNLTAAAKIYLEGASNGALTERRLKRGIEILVDLGEFQQVEHWAQDLANRESSLRPWAHFIVGVSIEEQGRVAEAIRAYETLLAEFPDSLEADRARTRLTLLQEANNEDDRNAG